MHASSAQDQTDFERVVALNEASKALITRSFQVNLLALDAMVQSKRGGTSLRGFDEVSSQMRSWSADLHQQLQELGALSRDVVSQVSHACKEARLLRLLEQADTISRSPALRKMLEAQRAEYDVQRSQLARLWRRVDDTLADLNLLGMMATVLSRAAMIEAASGNEAQRLQLSDVSQQFYRNSETVVGVLRSLTTTMRQGAIP